MNFSSLYEYKPRMSHHANYSNFNNNHVRTDRQAAKKELLELLIESYKALASSQSNWICNLANCSSLLWHCYNSESLETEVNWSGFYVVDPSDSDKLILGPFMGKVACQEIQIGRGVCGTAARDRITQLVKDVENFPGHIACDGETKSEIVVPIIQNNVVRGVLDIDCLVLGAFDDIDRKYLEELAEAIADTCVF